MKTARRKTARFATLRAAALPTFLWSGTAYGLAGLLAHPYTVNAADQAALQWGLGAVVGALVLGYLIETSRNR